MLTMNFVTSSFEVSTPPCGPPGSKIGKILILCQRLLKTSSSLSKRQRLNGYSGHLHPSMHTCLQRMSLALSRRETPRRPPRPVLPPDAKSVASLSVLADLPTCAVTPANRTSPLKPRKVASPHPPLPTRNQNGLHPRKLIPQWLIQHLTTFHPQTTMKNLTFPWPQHTLQVSLVSAAHEAASRPMTSFISITAPTSTSSVTPLWPSTFGKTLLLHGSRGAYPAPFHPSSLLILAIWVVAVTTPSFLVTYSPRTPSSAPVIASPATPLPITTTTFINPAAHR